MTAILYTVTGCERCRVVKAFMDARGLAYTDVDAKGEGKNAFVRFYRDNQAQIMRGPEGIQFPIYHQGEMVRQGLGVILSWLHVGVRIEPFVRPGLVGHGWAGGFNLSGGPQDAGRELLPVLRHLREHGIKIRMETDGRNSDLLKQVLVEGLADHLQFNLLGPAEAYARLPERPCSEEEINASLSIAQRAGELSIVLRVAPLPGGDRYLSPEEAATAAAMVAAATQNNRIPFGICILQPSPDSSLAPLPATAGFKYRTVVRRYMLSAEILASDTA